MTLKDFKQVIFKNHYKPIGFTKQDSFFAEKSRIKDLFATKVTKKYLTPLKLENNINHCSKIKVNKFMKHQKTVT